MLYLWQRFNVKLQGLALGTAILTCLQPLFLLLLFPEGMLILLYHFFWLSVASIAVLSLLMFRNISFLYLSFLVLFYWAVLSNFIFILQFQSFWIHIFAFSTYPLSNLHSLQHFFKLTSLVMSLKRLILSINQDIVEVSPIIVQISAFLSYPWLFH